MSACLLQAIDLSIGYPMRRRGRHSARVVAQHIHATLQTGELVCLAGPNGAGKSTLLRTLCGLQPPLAGQVLMQGRDIRAFSPRALAQTLSLVLTDRVDAGNLSVFDLVLLGRHPFTNWLGHVTARDERAAWQALEAVGITHLAQRPLREISDGERQKTMLARALAQEPRILILDEPTAFLDLPHRIQMLELLRKLAHDSPPHTVALSTHDLDLALRVADVIWLLPAGGPLQTGAPEDLALSGALDVTFGRDNIHFDRESGAFRQHAQPVASATVIGQGIYALWTQRALERLGFTIQRNAPVQVALLHKHHQVRWRLCADRHQVECASIYELSQAVKHLLQINAIPHP